MQLPVKAKVWVWNGPQSWHFVTIPKKFSKIITDNFGESKRGFGSIRVQVSVGESKWKTSIFPMKEGTFVLPLKAQIRKEEKIKAGKTLSFLLIIDV